MTMEDLDYLLDRIAFLEDRLTQIESKLGWGNQNKSVYGTGGIMNAIHTKHNTTSTTTTHLTEVYKEIQRLKAEAQAKTLIPPTKLSTAYYSDVDVSLKDYVVDKGIVDWYNEYYRSHKPESK
jgi:hypothetical protein